MLMLEGKSPNRSMLQMGSIKVVYWPHALLHLPISNARRGIPRHGAYLQSRQSADLFNVAHFRAKTKTTRILTRELLFADDSALVAHSAEEMQKIVSSMRERSFSLKINIKKTEVLYQPNSTRTREEDIMVDGNKLNSVLESTYLGSTISSNGCIDDEIQRRMAKASASFGKYRWRSKRVRLSATAQCFWRLLLFIIISFT